MEENISENRFATAQIAHSSEVILPIPIGQFYAELNENPPDYERIAQAFRDQDKSMRNKMENSHICNVCDLVFSTNQSLLNHLLVHFNQQDSVCEESEENRFATAQTAHSSEIILPIPVGDFDAKLNENPQDYEMFAQAFRGEGNSMKNKLENTHICNMCGLVFSTKQSLLNHLLVHSHQEDSVCEESLRTSSERNNMPHLHVCASEESFICEVCGKSFRTAKSLRSHFRTHSNHKPYVCDICSEAFKWKGNLTSHLRIHTNDKPYICVVCCERFNRRGNLKSHSLTHTQEKPYVCKFCGAGFIYGSNLTEHLRVHTKEKPYSCEICSKAFARLTHLKLHLRTHTKEKPYVCELCSKAFSDRSYLRRHFLIHTKEKSYVCEVCSKTFARSDNLKSHLLTHSK